MTEALLAYWWFFPIGIAVGAFGTLIGAGGGFILVPVLVLLYPNVPPETITSVSLAVVFLNALSGSYAYSRMGRVDYKSGLIFAAATVPGAILGALTSTIIPRRLFDLLFGVVMLVAASFLFLRPLKAGGSPVKIGSISMHRLVIEKDGTKHEFDYNPLLGFVVSLGVGYLSSLLGIGGGIIHVPFLSLAMNFPVHIATATSHFVLAITSFTGTLVHIWDGDFNGWIAVPLIVGAGVLIGAQIGARWSTRVRGPFIIRGLAIALGLVGLRIVLQGFFT